MTVHFRYMCLAGTGGRIHTWAHDPLSPFQQELHDLGGEPITNRFGELYTWSGKLNGTFWTGDDEWHREADVVEAWLRDVPLADRILFAHSHGGQIPIILARRGFKIRTLTTFATPYRPNLGPEEAAQHIGFWQHVYDPEKDWIASTKRRLGLGGIGGGGWPERRFMIPGVINVAIPEIRHSRAFTEHLPDIVKAGVLHRAFQQGL